MARCAALGSRDAPARPSRRHHRPHRPRRAVRAPIRFPEPSDGPARPVARRDRAKAGCCRRAVVDALARLRDLGLLAWRGDARRGATPRAGSGCGSGPMPTACCRRRNGSDIARTTLRRLAEGERLARDLARAQGDAQRGDPFPERTAALDPHKYEERRQQRIWHRWSRLLANTPAPATITSLADLYARSGDGLADLDFVASLVVDDNPILTREAVACRFRRCVQRGDFGFREYPDGRRVVRDLADLNSWNDDAVPLTKYSIRPTLSTALATPLAMFARRSIWAAWAAAQGWTAPIELRTAVQGEELPHEPPAARSTSGTVRTNRPTLPTPCRQKRRILPGRITRSHVHRQNHRACRKQRPPTNPRSEGHLPSKVRCWRGAPIVLRKTRRREVGSRTTLPIAGSRTLRVRAAKGMPKRCSANFKKTTTVR